MARGVILPRGMGTLESYAKMQEFYGPEQMIPLYIQVEDGERLSRALAREKQQKAPHYAEMCRRFLADEEDFSEEKLLKVGIAPSMRIENRKFIKIRITKGGGNPKGEGNVY